MKEQRVALAVFLGGNRCFNDATRLDWLRREGSTTGAARAAETLREAGGGGERWRATALMQTDRR